MDSDSNFSTPITLPEVRDYVVTPSDAANRLPTTLLINVRHSNLKHTRLAELRFNSYDTVAYLKERLHLHTGTTTNSMQLILQSPTGQVKRKLVHEDVTLSAAGIVSGDTLLVVDDDPFSASANGWLEDVSLAPKYEMSDSDYALKPNSVRAHKLRMRERNPTWSMSAEMRKRRSEFAKDYAADPPAICQGDRIEAPGAKRGEVLFVGRELQELPEGWWLGVRYDEPVGNNDGCVKGVRYFQALPKYGALVRPSMVKVGHFPPLDDLEDDEHTEEKQQSEEDEI